MTPLLIQAGPAYAAAMAKLHETAFPADPWDEKAFATLLASPGTTGFLTEYGGCVLIRAAADEAEILTIAVTAQRQGIGTALMRAAIEHATATACKTMFLEVAASNQAAINLYTKLKFSPAGRRKSYYANGEDALILSLDLTAV